MGEFMKTVNFQNLIGATIVTILMWSAPAVLAQDVSVKTAAPAAPAPQLGYGVSQILRLKQAEIGDETIIAYIKNSGNSYGLNADQIIYLRQQGVSDAVLTAMLQQPRPAAAAPTITPPAPQLMASTAYYSDSTAPATVTPAVTYVQTVPATTYYYQPYYYYPYYYSSAYCYPSYGWSSGLSFYYGRSYQGGRYYGGWHGGSGGGWHGVTVGGGWHTSASTGGSRGGGFVGSGHVGMRR
jgi:hypothetical protein